MRVLLGLGRVELADPVRREHLGERVLDDLLGEGDREVEVVAVAGHRRQVDAELAELLGELPRAVGAEVEEDRGVALGIEPRAAVDDDRLDELVGDAAVVARLHGGDRDRPRARPRRPRSRGARARCGPSACRGPSRSSGRPRSRCGRPAARRGRRTAECGDTSRPSVNAWIHVFSGANVEQRLEVVDVRMDAAVRDEPEQMDVLAALEGAAQDLVLEELAGLDRLVHAHEVLEEDPARADRQVPDLGVAHLTRRQADGLARRDRAARAGSRARAGRRRACPRARSRCPGRAARFPSRRG